MKRKMITVDGCTACALVAYAANELVTIYPITPSSPMAETCDALAASGKVNLWGTVPSVCQMQSEAGAAGAVHGSLTTGALTTTFTASQGLLLMIPNMYKIAGELTPTVFHVSARALAAQGLNIFGDHSDVMAARATGFALLSSKSVQEAMDFALISQSAALESRVPFLHFFDGFRTSHEVQKIEELTTDDMRAMIPEDRVMDHRLRGLSPDRPILRGTSQNPDVYFQGRETVNRFYEALPQVVQKAMDQFAGLVGRQYRLFDYYGHPEAERAIVIMGSAGETVAKTVGVLNARGEKLGLVQVSLYRPFSASAFLEAVPRSVRAIAVLDRTKEPGAMGEPLYLDVRAAFDEALAQGISGFPERLKIVGGRYGLGSKEFTPAMVKAVFDNLSQATPKNHFTIGIDDDVTGTSLPLGVSFQVEGKDVFRALFFGLGSDGTVGANKNTLKILGAETDNFVQGYFVYDSKKSGSLTTSHVRFGPRELNDPYLISSANFIACHNPSFVEKYDLLSSAEEGAVFLLTTPHPKEAVWDTLPAEVQEQLIAKKMKFYIIDAISLAEEIGLGSRINMIMQTAFFVISGVLPKDEAVRAIKAQIAKTYGKKGEKLVQMNSAAVDRALQGIVEVPVPNKVTSMKKRQPAVPGDAPDFVKQVTAKIISGQGDSLPVSAIPEDGTWPTGTTQYEKRNIAVHIPVWEPDICIQCGQCSFVCPHATIRMKAYDPIYLKKSPKGFLSADAKGKELQGLKFTLQVAPEDCTGCASCVFACPVTGKDAQGKKIEGFKAINMKLQEPLRAGETENYRFFLRLPETDPSRYSIATVKGSQLVRPLFEYNGACAGCGETPYLKLLTQLFGDRLLIGNATGCSSIYGGNLPTTPFTKRADGRGPAWSNSLFEDAAEFALGMRLSVDAFHGQAMGLIDRLKQDPAARELGDLPGDIQGPDLSTPQAFEIQRGKVEELKERLRRSAWPFREQLLSLADYLVPKSVWAVGGDGWAYDIGYGGLDHVLAMNRDVNLLVLDTEVYSNTGGQASKATPMGAAAKFATAGKGLGKKDLAMLAMTYGHPYVARVAMGAKDAQTVNAFKEADSYPGTSLIVAYSHCIAHGYDMADALKQQERAVDSAYWSLFRYDPRKAAAGES